MSSSSCGVLKELVGRGELSSARSVALQHAAHIDAPPDNTITPHHLHHLHHLQLDAHRANECALEYQQAVEALLRRHDHLALTTAALAPPPTPSTLGSLAPCFAPPDDDSRWEACCSGLVQCGGELSTPRCCALGSGSRNHLRLPALRQLWLQLRLPSGRALSVLQDGFLRPYDVSSVLWPAGYLLSLWTAERCTAWGTERPILELGAGVGAPALAAAASCSATVLATDSSAVSRLLVASNAALNQLDTRLRVASFDWLDDEQLDAIAAQGPFGAILGAALQFERHPRLWRVLEQLSRRGTPPIIALAHTFGALASPPHPFILEERVSGVEFGMHTRSAQNDTDFEVVVLRYSPRPAGTTKGGDVASKIWPR